MTTADTQTAVTPTDSRNGEAGRLCVQRLVRRLQGVLSLVKRHEYHICCDGGLHVESWKTLSRLRLTKRDCEYLDAMQLVGSSVFAFLMRVISENVTAEEALRRDTDEAMHQAQASGMRYLAQTQKMTFEEQSTRRALSLHCARCRMATDRVLKAVRVTQPPNTKLTDGSAKSL